MKPDIQEGFWGRSVRLVLVKRLKLLHPSSFPASRCALTLGNRTLPGHVNHQSLD